MKNSRYIKGNRFKIVFGIISILFLFSIVTYLPHAFQQEPDQLNSLWKIRSIDTMKTSRDKARSELKNKDFDTDIKKEIALIKETGANYVTIATPYDEEFKPYLKRWIKYAREADLHVWFRGNWSEWEGWFDYPMNMSPDEHLKKTSQFIKDNPDLFADGDIFEGCPECENAKHWKQPERNKEYNEFLRKQRASNKAAFESINKKVSTNIVSIIGGRAKEVVDNQTIKAQDNVVSIDHYVSNTGLMREYIEYFRNKKAKLVISEFGAPIPDKNGPMNETQQAAFINAIFQEFYKGKDTVIGINYYVSIHGTTPLINDDFSKRKAYQIVKNYFTPGIIKGEVENSLGDPLPDITITSADGIIATKTDSQGQYHFVMPPGKTSLTFANNDYFSKSASVSVVKDGSEVIENIKLEPKEQDWLYKTRLYLSKL